MYSYERLTSRPGRFNLKGIHPVSNWISRWVDPRVGLDAVNGRELKPLPGIEPDSPVAKI
jgi:hypothetical protein